MLHKRTSGRTANFRIPDFRVFQFRGKFSSWANNPNAMVGRQEIRPLQPVAERLGINEKDKIFVFAGFAGDWADNLGQTCKNVTYSDIDPQQVRAVRASKRNIRHFLTVDATELPRAAGQYDWSFSFEPMPLAIHHTLKMALLRSLLNNKGAIIAYRANPVIAFATMKKVARVYGASAERDLLEVAATDVNSYYVNSKIKVLKLLTNPQARRKAEIDLMVMNALQLKTELFSRSSPPMRGTTVIYPYIEIKLDSVLQNPVVRKLLAGIRLKSGQTFRATAKEIKESLMRLTQFSVIDLKEH